MREPTILPSARRHRVYDDDILHAFRYPWRIIHFDDMSMIIGPDRAGRLLEIGVAHEQVGDADVIFHAMKAQAKFLKERHA